MTTKVLKPLAASFALTKSAGGLTVYWSGEWRDRFGMNPVYVDLAANGRHAVAWFEFKHRGDSGNGYETARSDVIASTPRDRQDLRLQRRGIETTRPLLAVRVVFRGADVPGWSTKWIYNPYF